MNDEKMVTEKEAAAFLGLSVYVLQQQRSRGVKAGHAPVVPYVRYGKRCVRYSPADLRDYVAAHRVGG